MPQNYAGQRFHLNIFQRRTLMFRKVADLLLRKLYVVPIAFRYLIETFQNLSLGETKRLPLDVVKAERILANSLIPSFADIGQNCIDCLAYF